ncbi:MAG: LysR family transcriptional regulator [Ketobacteraceae bacterium]|nr:LysR family transcriptional regulator [Ketobacteraceae bacterium]
MARLELKHLRSLVAIRETGSLVEASQQVHLTQSALSHQLKELEERLGTAVVVRKSKPLKFTRAGERLLVLADQILPLVTNCENDISQMFEGGNERLHIAIECHSCFDWLMPTLDEFRRHFPKVELDLLAGFNFAPLPALAKGELDLVITSDPQALPDVEYIPLFRYESLLCVGKGHPLADKDFIEPEDIQHDTLIIYPVEKDRLDIYKYFLTPAGIHPSNHRTCELTIMMVQLVASNRGIAALPNWAAHEYLKKGYIRAKPLGPNGVWATLYAAVRKQASSTDYMSRFLDTARRISLETLSGVLPPDLPPAD